MGPDVESNAHFRDWVNRLMQGDAAAWRDFTDCYGPLIRIVVHRFLLEHPRLRRACDTDDGVQETLVNLCRRAVDENHFDNPAHFQGFLAKVARNTVRDMERREGRQKRLPDQPPGKLVPGASEPIASSPDPVDACVARDILTHLLQGADALTRRILELRLEGASSAMIAQELGVNERTVRKKLEQLKDWAEEPEGPRD